jgi:DGQHR domain-containing protein
MNTKSSWLTYDCLVLRQGAKSPEVAVFAIDAYELQELATVSRIADENRGYQRLINPRKLAAIRRYVEIPEAVLPTGIVLASGEKPGLLRIEGRELVGSSGKIWTARLRIKRDPKYKPLLVIDGQHRLYGITSSTLSPYPVPVTVLIGASTLVQMAHFVIINNKATRIETAHLNELRGMMFKSTSTDEEQLKSLLAQLGVASLDSSALVSELNGPGMVFEGILDFPSNKGGFVSSNILRQLVERSRGSGLLNYIPEDEDYLRAYNALWKGVSKRFSDRWRYELDLFSKFGKGKVKKSEVKKNQRLLHSASLFVLGQIADNELASSSIRKKWLEDLGRVSDLVQREIFGKVPEDFWNDSTLLIDNTSKGRKQLRKQLEEKMI